MKSKAYILSQIKDILIEHHGYTESKALSCSSLYVNSSLIKHAIINPQFSQTRSLVSVK